MQEDWRSVLTDLVVGYFSDEGAEEGLRHAAGVASVKESVHQKYKEALEAGIASAGRGEPDVLRIVRPIRLLMEPSEAKTYLENILSRYLEIYQEVMRARETMA